MMPIKYRYTVNNYIYSLLLITYDILILLFYDININTFNVNVKCKYSWS